MAARNSLSFTLLAWNYRGEWFAVDCTHRQRGRQLFLQGLMRREHRLFHGALWRTKRPPCGAQFGSRFDEFSGFWPNSLLDGCDCDTSQCRQILQVAALTLRSSKVPWRL